MTSSTPPELASSPSLDDGPIERAIIGDLEADLDRAHCVLLVGPYEVGKSRLAQSIARRFGPGASVLDASDPDHESRLTASELRGSRGRLIVIDEIHAAPDALDTIRLELESWARDRVPIGRFLLLSSRPLEAISLVAGKLATRVEIRSLTPIGISDLATARVLLQPSAAISPVTDLGDTEPIVRHNFAICAETLRLRGGFPKSLFADDDTTSFAWRERYIASLCNRGFNNGKHRLSATSIRELLASIAANQGEQRPIEGAAQKDYVDHLCELGLLRVLRPWHANETKRWTRSPKIYIRDTGLLHCLQRRRSFDDIRPAAGRLATAGRLSASSTSSGRYPMQMRISTAKATRIKTTATRIKTRLISFSNFQECSDSASRSNPRAVTRARVSTWRFEPLLPQGDISSSRSPKASQVAATPFSRCPT
jgi:predicted AAA+ superfamily ATPase